MRKSTLLFGNLPIKDEALKIVECMKIHDIFVAGNNYINQKEKIFSLEDISKLPLILLEKKSNSRKYVDNIFLENGLIVTPTIELGAHELLLQLAKINLGVSCVIKEFSTNYLENGDVFELKQEKPIPERAIGYFYLKNLTLSPALKEFLNLY